MAKELLEYKSPGHWAKVNQEFISLEVGNTIRAKYKGFEVVPNKFDPENETVRYMLETEFGEKKLETASLSVARAMDKVNVGDTVKISKEKYGKEGRYTIELVKEDK